MICLIISMVSLSCRSSNPQSRVKLDDGESIGQNSPNKVDGVFYTLTSVPGASSANACTGTAVSTTTAITAAHCVFSKGDRLGANGAVKGKKFCVSNNVYKNVCSELMFINENYPADIKGHDLAYIVFPEGALKAIFRCILQHCCSMIVL